jgi:hypothetical protein
MSVAEALEQLRQAVLQAQVAYKKAVEIAIDEFKNNVEGVAVE